MRVLPLMTLGIALFAQGVLASGNKETVENFVEAFNRQDIDAMLEFTTDDLRWMSIVNGQLSIETSNQDELREAMASYFASTPSARAEIRSMTESGPFVHTVEEALWSSHGAKKNQCGMAVYEILEGNIQNVWYFQVHECP